MSWKSADPVEDVIEKEKPDIAKNLSIKPGEEMMRAIKATDSAGSGIHLADRDIRITLKKDLSR